MDYIKGFAIIGMDLTATEHDSLCVLWTNLTEMESQLVYQDVTIFYIGEFWNELHVANGSSSVSILILHILTAH